MGTARDIQRSKVYRWEGRHEGREGHKLSRAQSVKYVNQMYGWHTTANIEESHIYTVLLEDHGDRKINTIKGLRRVVSGLGLLEAKQLADAAPYRGHGSSRIGKFYTREQAEKARKIILGLDSHEGCTVGDDCTPSTICDGTEYPHYGSEGAAATVKPWAPEVIFNTRHRRYAGLASHDRTEITLTDTKAIPIELWAVAHEVAHCVTPESVCTETGGAHGRLFMRHLIEILVRFKVTSMSLAELEASAKAAGVKVAPRTHSLRTKKRPKAPRRVKHTVSETLVLSGVR